MKRIISLAFLFCALAFPANATKQTLTGVGAAAKIWNCTVVYSAGLTAGNTGINSSSAWTTRTRYAILSGPYTGIRVRVRTDAGGSATVIAMGMGIWSGGTGTGTFNMTATPVPMTFGGGNAGVTMGASQSVLSDVVPFNFTSGQTVVFGTDYPINTTNIPRDTVVSNPAASGGGILQNGASATVQNPNYNSGSQWYFIDQAEGCN